MLSDVFGRLTCITMPSARPRQVREVDAHAMLTLRSRCTVAASVEPGDENSLFIIPQIDVRCRQLLQRSHGNERSTCLLVPKLDVVAGRLDERSGSAISWHVHRRQLLAGHHRQRALFQRGVGSRSFYLDVQDQDQYLIWKQKVMLVRYLLVSVIQFPFM
jgi:hypothetical protein